MFSRNQNQFRNAFFTPRKSLVEILIIIAISLVVASLVGGLTYMMMNDCSNGFWVRDAMGIPRCVSSQNVNILVH